MSNEKYLDALDSLSAFSIYKPNRTQRKTLMNEDFHGTFLFSSNQNPSTRFCQETSLEEAENEIGSDYMNDDDAFGDGNFAMGAPDDLPNAVNTNVRSNAKLQTCICAEENIDGRRRSST